MRVDDFDFELPPERIAAVPLPRRDASRLLVVDRSGERACEHRRFADLAELLPPGALLVVNDTRVLRARLRARKATGGAVELLLVEPLAQSPGREVWSCLSRASKPMRPGPLELEGERAPGAVVRAVEGERVEVELTVDEPGGLLAALERVGTMPLPPYIVRARRESPPAMGEPAGDALDEQRYQTIYAREPGAVAAPTAGLHFSPELFGALEARGVGRATVTLHVGPGTFAPLRSDVVEENRLHDERYQVPAATARAIAAARAAGRPVVAVGTTVARTLESAVDADGQVAAGEGRTRLFIYPGYRFRACDGLITNFHLPRSSLLMLVAAFAGRERVLAAYAEAIERGYRFYSYGDAMLIAPRP